MNVMFPDKIWNYKNFNMVEELDISGEFIYDGIRVLNQLELVEQSASLFSFLYHISVGLERLQKIVLVLFENVSYDNLEDFEKSLITHSHSALNAQIMEKTNVQLNVRENKFLLLLSTFYKNSRYERFKAQANYSEKGLLSEYIEECLPPENIKRHFINKSIVVDDGVKRLLGRVVGSLCEKYYKLIHKGCAKYNTFTYELRPRSKAEKVFLSKHRNNSLDEQNINERIVAKELIIYLKNTSQSNAFIRFLKDIPPLDLDIEVLNGYLSDLCCGIVPQSLMDEVENLYEENGYSVERMHLVDLIGCTEVLFDYGEINKCIQLLEGLINGSCEFNEFASNFPRQLETVDDECTHEILDDISIQCKRFLANEICQIELLALVKRTNTEFKRFNNCVESNK